MYDDLDQADNNQWKFCFSRSVFRYQKQWYESLFEQTLADFDKFGGVVETNRPDLKNAQYRDMIQQGDLLLNRIQKLARVVDV